MFVLENKTNNHHKQDLERSRGVGDLEGAEELWREPPEMTGADTRVPAGSQGQVRVSSA